MNSCIPFSFKALCNESAPEPVKLQLLLLLQEKVCEHESNSYSWIELGLFSYLMHFRLPKLGQTPFTGQNTGRLYLKGLGYHFRQEFMWKMCISGLEVHKQQQASATPLLHNRISPHPGLNLCPSDPFRSCSLYHLLLVLSNLISRIVCTLSFGVLPMNCTSLPDLTLISGYNVC